MYGQCVVVALIVQGAFGGKIRRGFLPALWAQKLGYNSHYWNEFSDGAIADLSKSQFPKRFPYKKFVSGKLGRLSKRDISRTTLLASPNVRARYELLSLNTRTL